MWGGSGRCTRPEACGEDLRAEARSSLESALGLVAKWADHLSARGYRPTTLRHYPRIAERWVVYLSSVGVKYDAVEAETTDRYIAHLHKAAGMKTWSVRCVMSVLRTFYKWLRRRRYVWENPFECLERMKATRPLPNPIPEAALMRLIDEEPDVQYRAMWEVFYATGCRISTLREMRIEDLDLDGGRIYFRFVKGGRDRYGVLGSKAIAALRVYLVWRAGRIQKLNRPTTVLWIGHKITNVLRVDTIRERLRAAARRVGIEGRIYPHRLRHSTATHLLEHGADLRVIQEVLLHEQLSTVEIYTQVATRHLAESVRKAHPRA